MALFGTDGIRGRFGELLTTELAERVAYATSLLIPAHSRVVVGRDTRSSGVALEAAIVSGFRKGGHDVVRLGVIPTPGLAFLTLERGVAVGVMITASHNLAEDNGIKIFGHDGFKIPDDSELEVESWVNSSAKVPEVLSGTVCDDTEAVLRYIEHLKASIDTSLEGLKLVVDCAHGAATDVAPRILRELGAEVTVIGGNPDGENINRGVGSTHLEVLQKAVIDLNVDIGIAHDGDADRTLMVVKVDSEAVIIDGDFILAALALGMASEKKLAKKTVVTTVMSNLGFHKQMAEAGITVEVTAVGDRFVLERMNQNGLSLGGEQSGHIIIRDLATTGDGILTSLRILSMIAKKELNARSLAHIFTKFPQVLVNVPVKDKGLALSDEVVRAAINNATISLGDNGRLVVRASGTENLVRVMAEARTMEEAEKVVGSLVEIVKSRHSI